LKADILPDGLIHLERQVLDGVGGEALALEGELIETGLDVREDILAFGIGIL
jgi:hypothetical protein